MAIRLMGYMKLDTASPLKESVETAKKIFAGGADGIVIEDPAENDAEKAAALDVLREICGLAPREVIVLGNVGRLEDVKKYLYAGAAFVVPRSGEKEACLVSAEAAGRFGAEKTGWCRPFVPEDRKETDRENAEDGAFLITRGQPPASEEEAHGDSKEEAEQALFGKILVSPLCSDAELLKRISEDAFDAVAVKAQGSSFGELRERLIAEGVKMAHPACSVSFGELKTDERGLIPCIAQDAENGQVLMMAWMDRDAFEETVRTGIMTYYSRSRGERWRKGDTSGHYQFLHSLSADCDSDVLLAKVTQWGAACHTGNRSCFYRTVLGEEKSGRDARGILEAVYDTIEDRRYHPKEGSYTNYLFDKGLDKILKKLGEESAETIIAAKNPDDREVVYEMADYLYHMMVLMAERGIHWTDITEELERRH